MVFKPVGCGVVMWTLSESEFFVACAAVFVPQANEKFYDLAGAAGFLSTTFVSLYYPSIRDKFWNRVPGATLPHLTSFAPRQLLLTACLSLWSVRLGSFLVTVRNRDSPQLSSWRVSSTPIESYKGRRRFSVR